MFEPETLTIDEVKARIRDIKNILIVIRDELLTLGPARNLIIDAFAVITMKDGQTYTLVRDEFEVLLDDGVLHRHKVPIDLIPIKAFENQL